MILGKATAKVESASNSFSHTCDEREAKEASLLSERRRPQAESASSSFSHTCDPPPQEEEASLIGQGGKRITLVFPHM